MWLLTCVLAVRLIVNGIELIEEKGTKWLRVKGGYRGTASAEDYSLDGVAFKLSNKDQKWLGLKNILFLKG